MLEWIALAGAGLAAYKLNSKPTPSTPTSGGGTTSTTGGVTAPPLLASAPNPTAIGPNSDPSKWYQGVQPGTVTLGGQPAGTEWQPGNTAGQVTSLIGTGVGIAGALGVGSAAGFGSTVVGSAAAPGFGAAGTFAGAAIPILGIGAVAFGTIYGIIKKHHAAALAAEGKALNTADPRLYNAFTMVLQAAIGGETKDIRVAQAQVEQIVSDYYGEVKSIQHGTWHFTGQDMSADYNKVWKQRTQPPKGAPGFSDYHAPDPCNAACVIGHFFAERGKFLVLAAVQDALAGNHGVLVLPAIPAHDTQSGFPEVRVFY